ncbi:MAG: AMP-binding protein [Oscillospiraceae bacterium]|nr:AMP-binding protein [Oscillospiraceae bacterium]
MDKAKVKSLQDLVRLAAEEYGDHIFIKEKAGKEIVEKSFNQFFSDTKKVASFLLEAMGAEKIHAATIGPTSYAYLVGYFGTIMGGNVTVPLDAQLACDDICDLMNRADVNVFFYDARYAPMLPAIKINCPAIKTYVALQPHDGAENVLTEIVEKYDEAQIYDIPSESLASIVYTSGTTGKAKGVMLTHGNLIDNAMCQDNESSPEDTLLSVLPIHHVFCFACDILLSLRYGATICVNDAMMRIAQNLKLFQPTIILLVPMIAETILKQINAAAKAKGLPAKAVAQAFFGGRLKGIYSGGAYLAPEIIKAYGEFGIPMAQGYGMTECSPRIATADFNNVSLLGDVGTIVNGCEVKIVDGEIVVKSPSVMQGYYKFPEATAEALDADGWLHTGDLGYAEDGRLYITGRKKNLIILSNGENVSPEELENKFAVIDLAAEVLVYAEEGYITAEILPNLEMCPDIDEAAAKLNEIIKEINTTLPSSKTIRRLRVRDKEFDKTTSKKIKRNQSYQGEIK